MPRLPKPFQRPRVEIGEPGRTWQDISPLLLGVGDIVPDHGKVTNLELQQVSGPMFSGPAASIRVQATFLSGEVYNFPLPEKVKAFTLANSPWPEVAKDLLGGER